MKRILLYRKIGFSRVLYHLLGITPAFLFFFAVFFSTFKNIDATYPFYIFCIAFVFCFFSPLFFAIKITIIGNEAFKSFLLFGKPVYVRKFIFNHFILKESYSHLSTSYSQEMRPYFTLYSVNNGIEKRFLSKFENLMFCIKENDLKLFLTL